VLDRFCGCHIVSMLTFCCSWSRRFAVIESFVTCSSLSRVRSVRVYMCEGRAPWNWNTSSSPMYIFRKLNSVAVVKEGK